MNIKALDLNLLRLFDVIHMARSVSQAADTLGLTQPAVSQGLTRLRTALGDPLFVRAAGGVRPTPRAERMAPAIHAALHALESAIADSAGFDPAQTDRVFRLHMTDIGEGRFLPRLITALREYAPHTRIETLRLGVTELALAMDQGRVDLAFGFLPGLKAMRSAILFQDRYIILMRKRHPLARRLTHHPATQETVRTLEFITVRTHAYTLTALETLQMGDRIRLTTEHFMALPAILEATDLAVIMPRNVALSSFAPHQEFALIEADFPMREFDVGIHWSPRYDADPANRWLRSLALALYQDDPQP
ncbi:LysR family transcriptional regulator [Castellaniella sp.]|uniref:LysR family transcriptional regulator n=1 Tax=Castellaniella sp. TaxID=1955812 RepID=UPI0025BAC92E|nr:LysR family transcriptional regulator [Castellaniella sp.]